MVSSSNLLLIAGQAAALPLSSLFTQAPLSHVHNLLSPLFPITSPIAQRLLLPNEDPDPLVRRKEVQLKRSGYQYGPSLLGETSFFPTGTLGTALIQKHIDEWNKDTGWLSLAVAEEAVEALAAIKERGGFKDLADYHRLYEDLWQRSVPTSYAQGEFTNFTSDLLFAMERLSVNPYNIRRLHPARDSLPFEIDDMIVKSLTGYPLTLLHEAGRLFYVDHSYQKRYPLIEGTYTAACEAYFYLDSVSQQMLPLAIKTNVGADLIYTPLDEENDWLLAKAMFNQNDLFNGQIFHLANSHAVAEIVHQAALRTMSDKHPVLTILDRLMYQAYAIRPIGERFLFNNGGYWDRTFAISNLGVRQYASEFYPTVAGLFESNYFEKELQRRGLIDSSFGPELPSFPFYEDGSELLTVIREFVKSYVDVYYPDETLLTADWELQAWIEECNGPAQTINFPSAPLSQKSILVDIIAHIAWLNGVSHHVLNTGEGFATSGTFPMHPAALSQPPPESKGIKNVVDFLPGPERAVAHLDLFARFNRPRVAEDRLSLLHMFDDENLYDRGMPEVSFANERFMNSMRQISEKIRTRSFGDDGLCQGMPFVWKIMDPAQMPFYLAV